MASSSTPPRDDFVLGTAQLGMDYGVASVPGRPDDRVVHELLKGAVRSGIRRFDTAPAYGRSERRLGTFCRQRDGDLRIYTKLPSLGARDLDPADVDSAVRQDVADSLERLGVPALEGLALHDPADPYRYGGVVGPCLRRLREQGLVRAIGVSVYTPDELAAALDTLELQFVQCPVSVLDHRFLESPQLERCREIGVEVHARSVLLQGVVVMDPERLPASLRRLAPPLARFRRICDPLPWRPSQVAIAYVRGRSEVDRLVLGVDDPGQLRENCAAWDLRLDAGLRRRIEREVRFEDEAILCARNWGDV